MAYVTYHLDNLPVASFSSFQMGFRLNTIFQSLSPGISTLERNWQVCGKMIGHGKGFLTKAVTKNKLQTI